MRSHNYARKNPIIHRPPQRPDHNMSNHENTMKDMLPTGTQGREALKDGVHRTRQSRDNSEPLK
jgi:hypothetical protein